MGRSPPRPLSPNAQTEIASGNKEEEKKREKKGRGRRSKRKMIQPPFSLSLFFFLLYRFFISPFRLFQSECNDSQLLRFLAPKLEDEGRALTGVSYGRNSLSFFSLSLFLSSVSLSLHLCVSLESLPLSCLCLSLCSHPLSSTLSSVICLFSQLLHLFLFFLYLSLVRSLIVLFTGGIEKNWGPTYAVEHCESHFISMPLEMKEKE